MAGAAGLTSIFVTEAMGEGCPLPPIRTLVRVLRAALAAWVWYRGMVPLAQMVTPCTTARVEEGAGRTTAMRSPSRIPYLRAMVAMVGFLVVAQEGAAAAARATQVSPRHEPETAARAVTPA